VHEEEVEVTDVSDVEWVEPVAHHVLGCLCGTVTDLGAEARALEATAQTVINTTGISPSGLKRYHY